ncbi:MAG: hypothetical protein H7248_11115 [Microbacteriaceae bacterium]|nr:hypothetical protein [Microbacteriaceae bacterium]
MAVNFASLLAIESALDHSQPSWQIACDGSTSTMIQSTPRNALEEVRRNHSRVAHCTTAFVFQRAPFLLTAQLKAHDSGRRSERVPWRGGASPVVDAATDGVRNFGGHHACSVIHNLQPSAKLNLVIFSDGVEVMNYRRRQIVATATFAPNAGLDRDPFSTSPGGDQFSLTVDIAWGVIVRVEKRFDDAGAEVHELTNVSAD